jgi:hypothetical protein
MYKLRVSQKPLCFVFGALILIFGDNVLSSIGQVKGGVTKLRAIDQTASQPSQHRYAHWIVSR